MDLLEYQAKELFQQVGIPILLSQTINDISELKRLSLSYPLVLKLQVRAGGRGKAGGIKFVENTIDAIAAASAIFHLPIAGEYPEVLLAEARYDSTTEIFLAIVVDYHRCCPVLMGSSKGGIDVETLLENMQSVSLREPFSRYHARRLAIKMGLTGALVSRVSNIIEKMYDLFVSYDLDMIEINPLGINTDGAVMALDGKIAVNDTAISRHPALQGWHQEALKREPLQWLAGDSKGKVALICNSLGLALSSWDLLAEMGLPVYGAFVVEDTRRLETLANQFEQGFTLCGQGTAVNTIFLNLATTVPLADNLLTALEPQLPSKSSVSNIGDDRSLRGTGLPSQPRNHAWQIPTVQKPQVVIRCSQRELAAWQEKTAATIRWRQDIKTAIQEVQTLTKRG